MKLSCIARAAVAGAACAALCGPAFAADLTGAGASFPAPLYAKWAEAYQKATGNKVNYQSIGSSGGIRQIKAKTVDFGASDAPLASEELERGGLIQFPTVIGGVVPVVNVPGVRPGALRLSGSVLADIYLGRIKNWNDKAIGALNPGLKLPGQAIAVVRRADGSGTSFIFTHYLSTVSGDWKRKVGEGQAVQWPVGLGGKGNEGVAAFVQRIAGAIGYVEYAYAKQNKLAHVLMRNADGEFVAPDAAAFRAAAAGADWKNAAFHVLLTDMPGRASWPISGATFILLPRISEKPRQTAEAVRFFQWAFANGDGMAGELDYAPLPKPLVQLIQSALASGLKDAAGRPVWPGK
jgi:phosphate transport system substrate-binding protein